MRVLTGELVAISQLGRTGVGSAARVIDLAIGVGRAAVVINRVLHWFGVDGPFTVDIGHQVVGLLSRDPDDTALAGVGLNLGATDEQNVNSDLVSMASLVVADAGAATMSNVLTFQGGIDDFSHLPIEHRPMVVRNLAHVMEIRLGTVATQHNMVIRYQLVEVTEAELVAALAFRR